MAAKKHDATGTVVTVGAVLVGGYVAIKLLPSLLSALKPRTAATPYGLSGGGSGSNYYATYLPKQQPSKSKPSAGGGSGGGQQNSKTTDAPGNQSPQSVENALLSGQYDATSEGNLAGIYNEQQGAGFYGDLVQPLSDNTLAGNPEMQMAGYDYSMVPGGPDSLTVTQDAGGLLSDGLGAADTSAESDPFSSLSAFGDYFDEYPGQNDTAADEEIDAENYDDTGDSGDLYGSDGSDGSDTGGDGSDTGGDGFDGGSGGEDDGGGGGGDSSDGGDGGVQSGEDTN